jgi:hypothetical protein
LIKNQSLIEINFSSKLYLNKLENNISDDGYIILNDIFLGNKNIKKVGLVGKLFNII